MVAISSSIKMYAKVSPVIILWIIIMGSLCLKKNVVMEVLTICKSNRSTLLLTKELTVC